MGLNVVMDSIQNERLNATDIAVLNLIKSLGTPSEPLGRKTIQRYLSISKRKIRDSVETLRSVGHPIVASRRVPYGYFIPRDDEERTNNLRAFKKQINTELETIKAIEKVDLKEYWENELDE